MNHVISRSICTPTDNGLVTTASAAGLQPGEWPQMIRLESEEGSRTYFLMRFDSKLGEVTGARYMTSTGGLELLIINNKGGTENGNLH